LSTLDIIVLFLVFALGLKGFLRGFIKEVAGLAAIIGGIFLASRFSSSLSDMFVSIFNMNSPTTATVVAFIFLFASIWIGITFAASMLSKLVDTSGMGIADKILGFIAAGGKIFLILSVIVFAFSNIALLQSKLETYTMDSFMYEPMKKTGGFVMKLKPDDFNSSSLVEKAKEEAMKEAIKEANSSLGAQKK